MQGIFAAEEIISGRRSTRFSLLIGDFVALKTIISSTQVSHEDTYYLFFTFFLNYVNIKLCKCHNMCDDSSRVVLVGSSSCGVCASAILTIGKIEK